MSETCDVAECTLAQTGKCVMNNAPETCANRVAARKQNSRSGGAQDVIENELGQPVVDEPPTTRVQLGLSASLGTAEVVKLMGERYATMIGLLGDPDAGKTACLVSIYLLVSQALIEGLDFADSRSLQAFEQIARGARRWESGARPTELTVRTQLTDNRQAGFLHLRLRRGDDGERFDVLLPDLPGEWTSDLVRTADAERLGFLASADVLWIMIDGVSLLEKEKRQGTIHRVQLLIERLAALLRDARPKLFFVPTRLDRGEPPAATLAPLIATAQMHGFDPAVVPIASFSEDRAAVTPGEGIARLMRLSLAGSLSQDVFWPDRDREESRHALRYRLFTNDEAQT